MRRLRAMLAASLLGLSCHTALSKNNPPSLAERLVLLRQAHVDARARQLSDRAVAQASREAYQHLFAALPTPAPITALSNDDLRTFYLATLEVAFYNADQAPWLDRLVADLSALQRRHIATDDDVQSVYEIAISGRRFALARRLAREHPDLALEPIPHIVSDPAALPGTPRRLMLGARADQLDLLPVTLSHEQIIVIAHPLCAFSQAAIRAIESDPALKNLFAQHAVWLAPADGRFELSALAGWNTTHPFARIGIAYQRDDWPMIDSWGLPTFYFLRDGKVFNKLIGWPLDGRQREALLQAVRASGFDR